MPPRQDGQREIIDGDLELVDVLVEPDRRAGELVIAGRKGAQTAAHQLLGLRAHQEDGLAQAGQLALVETVGMGDGHGYLGATISRSDR